MPLSRLVVAIALSALVCGGLSCTGSLGRTGGDSKAQSKSKRQYVLLDGQRTRVVWNDGDSFRILTGPKKELRARLAGYNTLESYGPVHFWGDFHGYELYDNAKDGYRLAKDTEWECTTLPSEGGYGRALVDCPALRTAIVRQGLAHIFHIGDGGPAPDLVEAQHAAQRERLGMWKKGIPEWIVTSIHSTHEKPGKPSYNRICSSRTGVAEVVTHTAAFETCDAWCHGGSCMIYAPFDVRYQAKKPSCLKNDPPNEQVAPLHLGYPMIHGQPRLAERTKPKPDPQPLVKPDPDEVSWVVLDGQRTQVHWDDGDTFKVVAGPDKDLKARLGRYNTLESYGPVHFWGAFSARRLAEVANEGTMLARSQEWECRKEDRSGGYGRVLVYCPDLVKTMLREGLGHVFHVGKGQPDPALVAIQLESQIAGRGMWAHGVPQRIVTSIHSSLEDPDGREPRGYNRVCDTRTGKSWTRRHDVPFKECDAWCYGGSCLIYIPYERRYTGEPAACLKSGLMNRLTVPSWLGNPLPPDATLQAASGG